MMRHLSNKIGIILALLAVLVFAHCTGDKNGAKNEYEPRPSDSIYTGRAALDAYAGHPDRALQIIDSAVIVGNLTELRADILRAIVYSRTNEDMKYDSAILICERLMLNDSVKVSMDLQEEILEVLLNACRMKKDNEQAMHWATQLCELYRSQGDETEALRNDAEIGTFLIRIGQQEEGLARIDTVIRKLDGKRKFNELDASIIALKRKAEICNEIALYGDMIVAAERMLDILGDYEQHPDEYKDGSIREPDDEDCPFYIDFYRGKAYAYMAAANTMLGNRDKAFEYIALCEQTMAGRNVVNRFMIAPTLGKLGEYDRMLAIYDEVEQKLGSDTLNANYALILQGRAEAAEAQGHPADANGYWRRYINLSEYLNEQLLQSKAHLFAARFHAQEQQREIERQYEVSRHATMIGLAISIFGLLVLMFAIYVAFEWHDTIKRNRILAFQITEALKYREKYRKLTQTPMASPAENDYSDMSDNDVFAYLRDVIECENLYLNPDFDRQTLIDRTGLPKEQINYDKIAALVRELRLDYAVRLMNEHPEMAVEQVCKASGYSKADTFTRNFKAKYGMTPTAYRETKK